MKKYFALVVLLFYCTTMSAQTITPKLEWYKTYDGPGNGVDLTNDIKMDNSNNIFLGGRSVGLDGTDLLILGYTEYGDSLLELIYNSAPQSWDEAFSLAIDSSSNIYVAGSSTFEQNTFYAILHKYSVNGELIWAKDFYDDININSEGIQVTLNSREEPIIGYHQNAAKFTKYSSSGDSLWTVSVEDDTSLYQINYLISDKNNNIYVAITHVTFDQWGEFYPEALIIKLSDVGEILWQKTIEGFGGKKIIFDNDENPIALIADSKIVKFNSDGDTLWSREYPKLGDIAIISDLIVDSNNDIVFAGYGISVNSWDYFTQKLSETGEDLWERIFNSDENLKDYARSIALDKKDNVYVTGGTHNSLSIGYCNTIKYSSAGEFKWVYKFDEPYHEFEKGNKIFVDDSNNVFVGGDAAGLLNGWNFLVFKIKQDVITGIIKTHDNNPQDFLLSHNYPNPFNPSTTITFSLPEAANIKLTVFNAIGQEIAELLKGNVEAGNHSITFDADNLNSGIYFYKLETGKFVSIKKMILLK